VTQLMKFKRIPNLLIGGHQYVCGPYLVKKTDHNRFGDTWTSYFHGYRISTATQAKHAIGACRLHNLKETQEQK